VNIAAELQTALESLVTAFKAACANPKPNYSLDGQSFSWADYLKMLKDGIKETAELLTIFDPVEARSIIL
jgi:hypothetical protein